MKKLIFKTVAVFAISSLMIIGLEAQPPRYGGGMGQGQGRGAGFGPGVYGNQANFSLNLSEEQSEQWTVLRVNHQKQITPLRNKMFELKAHQRTLMSEESTDIKAVNKGIDDQTALMNKIQKLTAEHRVAVKEILTDEQKMIMTNHWNNGRGKGNYGRNQGNYGRQRGMRGGPRDGSCWW